MRTPHLLLALSVSIFVLSGCRQPESSAPHSPYHPLISAFTSGDISNQSAIMVQFADSVAVAFPGEKASDSFLTFKPAIVGEAAWVNARTLIFKPQSRLPSDTQYEAEVHLGKLFPGEKKPFFFSFNTIRQNLRFHLDDLQSVSLPGEEKYQMTVRVMLADYAPDKEVEEAVTVFLDDRSMVPEWTHTEGREHLLKVNDVERGNSVRRFSVEAKKGTLTPETSDELVIKIPAQGIFDIIRADMEPGPRTSIHVIFSDPIDPNQDLGGLFVLGGEKETPYAIENNVVHLFPGDDLSGEQQLLVMPGIKSVSGKTLQGRGQFVFTFSSMKPAVEILGRGSIMPWSDGLFLPFKAVSLKAVKVRVIKIYEQNVGHFLQINHLNGEEQLKRAGRLVHTQTIDLSRDRTLNLRQWNTFSLELSKFIQPEPGAIYRIEMGFDREDAIFPCIGDTVARTTGDEFTSPGESDPEVGFWDNPYDYYSTYPYHYNPDFNWRERENPCSPSYYTRNRWVARNVLASNLGILAKKGDGNTLEVIVTHLKTTEPLANVEVKVFDFQMMPIAEGQTGKDGKLQVETVGVPFLLMAAQQSERGYLRLDEGHALAVDRFDVSGENVRKGLKGFIFGERGVWRPGDSIFVSFMPMVSSDNSLPENHPVTFELIDPRGRLANRQVATHPSNTLYTFRCKIGEDAPTGLWQARVTLGGVVFEKNLRVEAIRPNRLKINLELPEGEQLSIGQDVNFNLSSNWLHGAPASKLKADVRLNLKPAPTRFERYKDFTFDDPTRRFESTEQVVFEGILNQEGSVSFSWRVPPVHNAPGMLRGMLTSRVFEAAGTFSIDHQPVTVSPYSSYLGIRVPAGDERGMLQTDTTHHIDVVAVNDAGEPMSVRGVKYTIYKIDWRWWWEKSDEDLGRFISSGSHKVTDSGTINITQGKATIPFRIDQPEWGRYLVRVENPLSGHATAQTVMVDWPGWAGDSRDMEGASILSFQSDKPGYETGEEITVTFPSSATGRALVSIENGSRVLKSWWIEPKGEQTSFSFEATAEMTPNIYVTITLLQPHGQSLNNRPIRLFGTIPVMVEDPDTRLSPVVKSAPSWRPDQETTLVVSEAGKKEMDYIVAIVDEGLLDLTRYKTPDPRARFNAREALGVNTWDIYDQVLGAFGGKIEQLFSIGGDEALLNPEGENRMRRFEPMVRFIGPVHLKKGEKNTHTIQVPSYTGSVRVMVVASDGKATGSTHETVKVKQPLMVWSALPRLMGPGEKVVLPVTVFSMDEKINRVNVSVKGTNHFKVLGTSQQEVAFQQPGEKTLYFELATGETTGKGRIEVGARGSGETANLVTPIEIRMPNPPVTQSVSTILNPKGEASLNYTLPGLAGTNSATLEVSAIPPMNLARRLKFLLDYPHGCIEQIVSGAFPQLFLEDVVELSPVDVVKTKENISGVLQRLPSYQTGEGGFAYWPGQSQVNDWSTSYAGHFILQAEKKGFLVMPSLRSKWLSYQKRKASVWLPRPETDAYRYEQMLQAYRLYTLALAGAPDQSSMNRLRQQEGLIAQTRWLLSSAYVMAGLPEVAEHLMTEIPASSSVRPQPFTYGSQLRDRAILVEALLQLKRRQAAMPLVREIAQELSTDDWFSTQTTAFALMAVVNFTGGASLAGKVEFTYTLNNEQSVTVGTDKPIFQTNLDLEKTPRGTAKIMSSSDKELFATLTMKGVPGGIDTTTQSKNLVLKSSFLTMGNEPLEVSDIVQGTDFKYVVHVYNPGTAGDAKDLALTQMVPSGWEIRNLRLEGSTITGADEPDYRDIRDDRVYSYFDLPAGASRQFVVVCHAAFAGEFYLPPVSCEAMYNNEIRARIKGRLLL